MTIFFSSVMAGLNLSMKPTVRILFAFSASSISSCASFTVLVIGFSTNVWTPARRVLLATAKCVEAGVQMVTPSGLSFSRSSVHARSSPHAILVSVSGRSRRVQVADGDEVPELAEHPDVVLSPSPGADDSDLLPVPLPALPLPSPMPGEPSAPPSPPPVVLPLLSSLTIASNRRRPSGGFKTYGSFPSCFSSSSLALPRSSLLPPPLPPSVRSRRPFIPCLSLWSP